MPGKSRYQHKRIEVGDPFDRFTVLQYQTVHTGPFDRFSSKAGLQPELNEHRIRLAAPAVDLGAQAGKTPAEALELQLCSLNADHRWCQRLGHHDLGTQQLR